MTSSNEIDLDANFVDFSEVEPEIDLPSRIADDDRFLRSKSTEEGALGRNDSDYFHLWDLYNRVRERVRVMDADPQAFRTPDGSIDLMALKIYQGIISETRRMLETLNKMRNSDRVTAAILEQHTKSYAEALAIPLGERLRTVVTMVEKNPDLARQTLMTLLQRGLVDIFRDAGVSAMSKSKETYNLN